MLTLDTPIAPSTPNVPDGEWKTNAVKHGEFYFGLSDPEPTTVREKYFVEKGKTFSPQACAVAIGRQKVFRKHPETRDLYVLDEEKNVFTPADELVSAWAQKQLGHLTNTNRVNEIIAALLRTCEEGKTPHPRYVQLKNCVFDLFTNQPVNRDPSWFFTRQHPVFYDPLATCDAFNAFFKEAVPNADTRLQLLEFVAYCFYYDRPLERSNFVLWGSGANGKSTFLNVVRELLGPENVSTLSLHDLEERFGPINLFDKVANIHADLPSDELDSTSKFKQITGGDSVFCDRKGKPGFSAVMPAKFVFSANSPPQVPDHEPALFRRIILVHFGENFEGKEKPNLKNELVKPSEVSGVFNLVSGLLADLLARNKFHEEPTTAQTQELYVRLSRPVNAFIKDCLEYPVDDAEIKHDVYRAYKEWAITNKRVIYSFQGFAQKLKDDPELSGLVFNTKDTQLRQCWGGIKLKNKTTITRDELVL